jgi:hypothetical protein
LQNSFIVLSAFHRLTCHCTRNFFNINDLINVAEASPRLRNLELEVRHVKLKRFGRPIIVPQFETALNVIKSSHPLTLDVAFECRPEYRREFLDMLL